MKAHLRMSLRDVPCVSANSGKNPFRGCLRHRPLACEKLFWGYRGLAPYGLGLDERVLKMDWVNARGCGKIILIARVRHFRMKKPPLVAWTL